jgi:adenine-specific DNA-methyltransferase
MLMDEIFGAENFVVNIAWKKRGSAPNDRRIGATHEFIIGYGSNTQGDSVLNRKSRLESQLSRYRNPDSHPKGVWAPDNLMANVKGGRYVESLYFPITNPATGKIHYPSSNGNWRFNQEAIKELLANDEIYFGKEGDGRPKLKRFLCDVKSGIPYGTIWDDVPLGSGGTREIQAIFGNVNEFDTPKPVGLIRQVIEMSTGPGDIILDSFAGSGTTAHAVLALNKEDGGNRRFILVECEDYADGITAERVRRVIDGAPGAKDKALREGLGGSFTYCTLGEPVDLEAMLTGDALPSYPMLAAYLLHTGSGLSADGPLERRNGDGLFYADDSTHYHLIYEPCIGFLRSNDAVLSEERARRIGASASANGKRAVVFAAGKYLGQRELSRLGVTFCQLPYEIYRDGAGPGA